jgi:tRNA(Ile)-lysidine synthase
MPQEEPKPVSVSEAKALFADLASVPSLVVAVSGGPDSTALLYLLSRWRAARKRGPKLFVCTVDHRLRKESADEAKAVSRLARKLKVPHRILQWRGKKPSSGIQRAAREARYRLLARAAADANARHIVIAHTLDDQAETVLLRFARGSGLTGLSGMSRIAPLPVAQKNAFALVRPLLSLPKARLVATLRKAGIAFAEDPSNDNPRFTRVRLRGLAPLLEEEGLSASRLTLFAQRVRRAEIAFDAMVKAAAARLAQPARSGTGIGFDRRALLALPEEVVLRLLGKTIDVVGHEGPVELGKLETLMGALFDGKGAGGRRTLAGALVTSRDGTVTVEPAPRRRGSRPASPRS